MVRAGRAGEPSPDEESAMLPQHEGPTLTREDAARELARAHREGDEATQVIRWYRGGPADEIRLLEASAELGGCGDIFPVRFKPTADIPYSTVVILVSAEELEALDSGEESLPDGWDDAVEL
jgi:hypothetical protein